MKYQYMLLDGCKVGVNVSDTGLQLSDTEMKVILCIFKKLKAKFYQEKQEYVLVKAGKEGHSDLRISLRRNAFTKANWYLNVDGNPIKHFHGQNVYGNADAGRQIRKTFEICLRWLEKKSGIDVLKETKTSVAEGHINIHSVEFAAYTNKIQGDIGRLLNAWRYMYRTADWMENNRHESLDEMLSINTRIDSTEYENSFALALVEKADGRTYRTVSLRMYRKVEEMEFRQEPLSVEIKADIEKRLRLDIEFSNRWLLRRKVRTISDLEAMISKRYDNDWCNFLDTELQSVVRQSALQYMWVFQNIFVEEERKKIPEEWFAGEITERVKKWALENGIRPEISYKAHVAMLEARAREHVTGEQKLLALKNKEEALKLAAAVYENSKTIALQASMAALSFDKGGVNVL